MQSAQNRILTPSEVCEILKISSVTLWRERKAGRITFRRVASKVVFLQQDIDEYVERNTQHAFPGGVNAAK